MKKLTIGLLASCLIFLGGCGKQENKAVIKVNGEVITKKTFDETFDMVWSASGEDERQTNPDDPKSKFMYLVHKSRVINDLIIKELIAQEADKRQIEVKETDIDAVIDKIAASMGSMEKFESSLDMNKIDKDTFRNNIRLDLIKKKLISSVMGDNNVSDEEIKKFYDENKDKRFKHDEEVRASHILISASEMEIKSKLKADNNLSKDELENQVKEELAKAKAKAKELLKELKANPDKFAEVAKQYSEDPSSATKGGDLGFFSKEEMVPEFSKAAFSTKPGQISDVVKTQFGYHIIKVVDKKEQGITPYDEIKVHIKRYLEGKKEMDTLKKLITTSRDAAKIEYLGDEYDPEVLKAEYKAIIDEIKASRAKALPKQAPNAKPNAEKQVKAEQK